MPDKPHDSYILQSRVEWYCQQNWPTLGIEKMQLVLTLKDRYGTGNDRSAIVTFHDGTQVHLDLTSDNKVAGRYTNRREGVLTS